MNLRPGIDTPPPSTFLIAKLSLRTKKRDEAIACLKTLGRIIRSSLDPERRHARKRVVDDWAHNVLVAFGLPFFLGPLKGRSDSHVQNFPPGGIFEPRDPKRFEMNCGVPLYLRTMAAAGDKDWVARYLTERASGKTPTPSDVDEEYLQWLSAAESDLLLYIEGNQRFLNIETWDRIEKEVCGSHPLDLVGRVQESFGREDGRDLIGWHDPKSNLDDDIKNNPAYYRSKIYLPHPAPMYPGEPVHLRDALRYNGGTYLVHRKYELNMDKWNDPKFAFHSKIHGKSFNGEDARKYAIGRDRESGRVICGSSGKLLDSERRDSEVSLALQDSHIAMARGVNPAPFEGPFVPLKEGDVNVFNIQDIRIRRRGGNWREVDSGTGNVRQGLHFFCFQNNIQQTGFEFINNIWLMNPAFRQSADPILDPNTGIASPIEGAYYFVPPPHRQYPGEVFFEGGD